METLSDFYDRLPGLIDSYKNTGSSFDAYLATSFRLHLRSYMRKHRKDFLMDILSQHGAFGCFERHIGDGRTIESDTPAYDQDPSFMETHDQVFPTPVGRAISRYRRYNANPAETFGKKPSAGVHETPFPFVGANVRRLSTPVSPFHEAPTRNPSLNTPNKRRRVLYMTIKNIAYFDYGDLDRVAEMLQVSPDWLRGVHTWAFGIVKKKIVKRQQYIRIRDRNFVRLLRWEQALENATSYDDRESYLKRIRLYQDRLAKSRERLRRLRLTLPHSKVAALLGVPKGSVDSAMAKVRKGMVLANRSSARYRNGYGHPIGKQ